LGGRFGSLDARFRAAVAETKKTVKCQILFLASRHGIVASPWRGKGSD